MNKKIFTLLAGTLMLFMAVFAANAQRPWSGDTVRYLPEGIGKGAYHLKITEIGTVDYRGTNTLIAMDDYGFVGLVNSTFLTGYEELRRTLWCVKVEQENYGQVPAYTFTNKQYSIDLAVTNGAFNTDYCASTAPGTGFPEVLEQVLANYGNTSPWGDIAPYYDMVYSTGDYSRWWFSYTYNSSPLETNQFLRVQIDNEPDYYLTFASDGSRLSLVKVHKNDFNPGTVFADKYLVRFSLLNAAPWVLNADDFNSQLYELPNGTGATLSWDPDVSAGYTNVFAQSLTASNVPGTSGDRQYLYLKSANGYLWVTQDYYNESGNRYPIIRDNSPNAIGASGVDEFRMVYYPSEDSVIINVREIVEHPQHGTQEDPLNYDLGYDELYNWTVWNYLTVRLQDLDNQQKDFIITVANKPSNTRAYFDIRNCEVIDPNRTTIEPDLYTIRDRSGRYLVVPMAAGDFTPQWRRLTTDDFDGTPDTIEVALKTPSYQWFVTKVHQDSDVSRIFLTNREFEYIRLEYVQIYKDYELFSATWRFLTDTLNSGATYVVNDVNAYVSASGFSVVQDDPTAADKKKELVAKYGTDKTGEYANHQVEAWMRYMPEDLMQKLYRTSPFLGYKAILPDTLNYYGYSFNYLNKLSNEYYMGVTESKNSAGDTSIYVEKERTFFELNLPDTLRAYGRERYGLGHGTGSLYQNYENTKDIAPLERYYYYFRINDYYKYAWNDYYLVLDDAARYVYTNEANANSRRLNKAKFYMRFTYDKNNTEHYTLIDRIDKSNFDYLTNIVGLQITDTLKAFDDSHGGITNKSFGVIVASVYDRNLYVGARAKTLGNETPSTFSLGQMTDELYRRFNVDCDETGDDPRILKFYRYDQPNWYVYEDGHSAYVPPGSGINFMGVENITQRDPDKGQWMNSHNYAIYVDTAYVNRGTGHIKPQYLLVVGPQIENGGTGCNACGDSIDFRPYVYGRYLRNMTDSARVGGIPNGTILDKNYIWNSTWERLAFVEAIHAGDSLYILNGTPISNLYSKDNDGTEYLNFARVSLYPGIVVRPLDNNLHKDEVFSMRFVERQRDKVGNKIDGASKRFYMESETTNRDPSQGRMIAPMNGGWVKWQNGVPVISRGSFYDAIYEAEEWDVECAAADELPTSNDDVTTAKITVVSNTGSVSILNATGKQVVISNVLGQTIANEVLTSDNATISAPKGIVVVAIEGEQAVKTIVK